VAELDRDALGRRRRITRPLALAVLDRMEAAAGGEEGQEAEGEAEDDADVL